MRETLRKTSGAVMSVKKERLERSPSVRPSKEMGVLFSRCLTGRRNGGAALTGAKKEFTST